MNQYVVYRKPGIFGFADLEGDGDIEGVFLVYVEYYTDGRYYDKDFVYVVDMSTLSVEWYLSSDSFGIPDYKLPFRLDYSYSLSIVDFNLDGYYDLVLYGGVFEWRGYLLFVDGATHRLAYVHNISFLGKLYLFSLKQQLQVIDLNFDGFVEIIKPNDMCSIVVFSVDSIYRPLVYWMSPWGYFDAFGRFDLFDGDYDGIADWVERLYGFDPTKVDSDGDGIPDRREILEVLKSWGHWDVFVVLKHPFFWIFVLGVLGLCFYLRRRKLGSKNL